MPQFSKIVTSTFGESPRHESESHANEIIREKLRLHYLNACKYTKQKKYADPQTLEEVELVAPCFRPAESHFRLSPAFVNASMCHAEHHFDAVFSSENNVIYQNAYLVLSNLQPNHIVCHSNTNK